MVDWDALEARVSSQSEWTGPILTDVRRDELASVMVPGALVRCKRIFEAISVFGSPSYLDERMTLAVLNDEPFMVVAQTTLRDTVWCYVVGRGFAGWTWLHNDWVVLAQGE